MPRDIQYVIHTPGNPVVAILIAECPIAGHVVPGKAIEICFPEPFMVTVDRPHKTWPCGLDAEITARWIALQFGSIFVKR